jgi:hypothetical protein
VHTEDKFLKYLELQKRNEEILGRLYYKIMPSEVTNVQPIGFCGRDFISAVDKLTNKKMLFYKSNSHKIWRGIDFIVVKKNNPNSWWVFKPKYECILDTNHELSNYLDSIYFASERKIYKDIASLLEDNGFGEKIVYSDYLFDGDACRERLCATR